MSKKKIKLGLLGIVISGFGLIISLLLFYAEPAPSHFNIDEIPTNGILYFTSVPSGGLAIFLGILALLNSENHREAYISVVLGIFTIAFPFIKLLSLALLCSLIVSGILAKIISRKEL
ncbi:MAG: hypothetical protein R3D86_08645 [Emcibacteraceae bacterium]